MPKRLTIAEATYQAGTYGPLSIDQFSNVNTDIMELVMTVVNWPAANPLMEVIMSWGATYGEVRYVVPWTDGLDKFGNPITEAVFRISVPQRANGKAAVQDGYLKLILHQTLTTAVSLEALQT